MWMGKGHNHKSTNTYSVVPTTYFKLLIIAVGPEARPQSGPWARLKRALQVILFHLQIFGILLNLFSLTTLDYQIILFKSML